MATHNKNRNKSNNAHSTGAGAVVVEEVDQNMELPQIRTKNRPKKMFRLSSDADALASLRSRARRASPVYLASVVRAKRQAAISKVVAVGAEVLNQVQDRNLVKQLPSLVCVPNSRAIRCWDLYTMTLLIYVAIVTPFQMAFLSTDSLNDISSWMGLFILDRLVDITFFIDIFVNFRTGWIVEHSDGTVEYRYTCKEGSRRYVRGWFFVDVVSILPVEVLDVVPSLSLGTWGRMSKIFKLFRFAKLMKILRATRIFSRWEKELVLKMPYGAIRLVKFVIIFFAVVHWLGCIFYFVQVLAKVSAVQYTWVDVSLSAAQANDLWGSYLASVHWSLATITTVGYGDVKPVSTAERIIAVVGMIIGTTMFAFVIGTMINLIEGFMVRKTSFQNYMDVLSSFSQRVGVPRHLLKRLHNFGFEMEERFDIPYDRVARTKALDMLSPFLRANVLNIIYERALSKTELMIWANDEEHKKTLIHCMASYLQRRTHGHYETVAEQGHKSTCLFILTDGTLLRQRIDVRLSSWKVDTKLIYPQSDFGTEAVLFPNGNCKWQHTYKTENSMCEFLILTADAFQQVSVQTPGAMACIAKVKKMITYRRAKRLLGRPESPAEIVGLLQAYHKHQEEEHNLFNIASDELLKEIIQRKTAYLKHIEETARSDMGMSMEELGVTVAEKLQTLKHEMLSISVTSLLKKKSPRRRRKKRHGAGKKKVPRVSAKLLHTPHANSGQEGFGAASAASSGHQSGPSDGSVSTAGSSDYFDVQNNEVQVRDLSIETTTTTTAKQSEATRGGANDLWTPTSRDPLD